MVDEFIKNNWKKTIRYTAEDGAGIVALPYPYTVPSIDGMFQEMYYWDTYFTNKGLIRSGMRDTAMNNVNNILYMVEKYGYMPNGNNVELLDRSQPPFLSNMVKDIYEQYKDIEWLKRAYKTLKKEYDFWTRSNMTKTGLSQYKGIYKPGDKVHAYAAMYKKRTGYEGKVDDTLLYRHSLAVFESGWDITPRWDDEAYNYVQVDLNSLLYMFEYNMALFASIISADDAGGWIERMNGRVVLMRKYMLKDGIYFDYNIRTEKTSVYFTVASFFPLFAECASEEEAKAVVEQLKRIEFEHGISACENRETDINCQWSYPNAWAPLTYIVVKGLLNYGYTADAGRIARKYVNAIRNIYAKTGKLWEKYNAVTGDIDAVGEYGMPPMLGWTAGVYLLFVDLLNKQ